MTYSVNTAGSTRFNRLYRLAMVPRTVFDLVKVFVEPYSGQLLVELVAVVEPVEPEVVDILVVVELEVVDILVVVVLADSSAVELVAVVAASYSMIRLVSHCLYHPYVALCYLESLA